MQDEWVKVSTLSAYAALNFASRAFRCFSLMIVEPRKSPMAESPTTRINAGNLIAHSRGGNQVWMTLELSKKG